MSRRGRAAREPAAWLGALLLVAAVAWAAQRAAATGHAVPIASRAEIDRSVAGPGIAWIWPLSNGPAATWADAGQGRGQPHEAAVLVETLLVQAQGVARMPRTQPLALPAGTRVLPVLHVESEAAAPDELLPAQRRAIVAAFLRHVDEATAGAGMIQLDFEAPHRQRASYVALVAELRQALPPRLRLSVTALAHWCVQSDWLDRLPVDEVVVMLYRLGPHAQEWRDRWAGGDRRLALRCRGPALGFATNDPPPRALLAGTARPYWFDESGWSNPSLPRELQIP